MFDRAISINSAWNPQIPAIGSIAEYLPLELTLIADSSAILACSIPIILRITDRSIPATCRRADFQFHAPGDVEKLSRIGQIDPSWKLKSL
jgi:hypothetical protein